MPNIHHDGIEQCFFLPVNEPVANRPAFDLLLLCLAEPHCLGLRFEPAQTGTHEYGHVQMNRKMMVNAIEVVGIPNWIPESYPALPLRTSDPFQLFLSMATSVHGYRLGMTELFENVIPEPRKRKKYLDELNEVMG
jgi:hypothetical protein